MKYAGLISRYIFILLAGLGNLYIFYQLFTPLTIKAVYLLLSIFSQASIQDASIIFRCMTIEIIPSCVAGSAYYLLFILNLSTPNIKIKDRIKILLFSFACLFILNVVRITFLALIFQSIFFNIVHIIFWYVISIIFVAGIWIFSARFFKIKSIPIYTDVCELYKITKHKIKKK